MKIFAIITVIVAYVAIITVPIAAWVTHVVICIKASAWLLLAFGCIIAPIGVIHGAGSWLGIW